MTIVHKICPECNKEIGKDEIYFVAPDEDGDYDGRPGEMFRFHPKCWAIGECWEQGSDRCRALVLLATATLRRLRTEYDNPGEVAAHYMPDFDETLAALLQEVNLLRALGGEPDATEPPSSNLSVARRYKELIAPEDTYDVFVSPVEGIRVKGLP